MAFVGEMLISPLIDIKGISPDFSVISLAILALAGGTRPATVGGFILGLVQDLTNPSLLGLHALCKCCLGYGFGSIRERIVYGMPVVEGAMVTFAVLAHDLLFLLVQSRLNDEAFLMPFLTQAIPVAIYSGLVGILVLRMAEMFGILRQED